MYAEFLQDRRYVVIHGFRRAVEAAGELRIRPALDDEDQHLEFLPRQPRRVGASSLVGAARYATHTALAQTPSNDCSERARPQAVKTRECLAQCILRTFSKSERPLVRHADAFPGACGCAPFTRDHQSVRLRDVIWDRANGLRPRLPEEQLTLDPRGS